MLVSYIVYLEKEGGQEEGESERKCQIHNTCTYTYYNIN